MTLKKLLPCLVLCATGSIFGMTYDNRFFPLLDKPVLHQDDTRFFTRFQPFYMFGSHCYDIDGNDRPLFGMFGQYNQIAMDNALLASKKTQGSLLPPFELKTPSLPWLMTGKVDAAGLAFRWYYSLTNFMDVGGSCFFAGSRSRLQALFDYSNLDVNGNRLNAQQVQDFYNSQQQMFEKDDVRGLIKDSFGISDLDFYVRFGFMRHHFLKFRTFDVGVKLGVIAPTAKGFDLAYPSSLIFGGDQQWGMYVDTALDAELKEDLFAGLNMRFIQRFKRTDTMRLPLFNLPNNFGIWKEEDKVSVTPGFTFVFSPYGGVANLRDGFGLQVGYTLILHTSDKFNINAASDVYPDKSSNITETLKRRSKWGSEYITCSAIYDFAKDKECRGATPCVSLDIDIPISVIVAQQSFKTYGISLRIESDLW